MKKLALLLALAGAFAGTDALAWGNDGHRAIGAMADQLIKGSNAEKQVRALLLPGESLESVAMWADSAKGGAGYTPPTPEMEAYAVLNPKHLEYHFTSVPFQHTHYHDGAVGAFDHDIVHTLKQAISVLQGKTGPDVNPHNFTRRQALLIITHMTGDIHQPLHVGVGYVTADGKFVVPEKRADVDAVKIFDSRGGNNLLLDNDKLDSISGGLIPGSAKPLPEGAQKYPTKPFHSYWDSTVVDYAMRRVSTKTPEQFARKVIEGQPQVAVAKGDASDWPYQWASETLDAAKLAYSDVTVGKMAGQISRRGENYATFALEMGPNYPVPSSALAKTQLTRAGYRLASLLQTIWPG